MSEYLENHWDFKCKPKRDARLTALCLLLYEKHIMLKEVMIITSFSSQTFFISKELIHRKRLFRNFLPHFKNISSLYRFP